MKKLEFKSVETKLSPREKSILTFIGNNAGCKSGEVAKKLGIPSPTVKRILPELIAKNLIDFKRNGGLLDGLTLAKMQKNCKPDSEM